MQLIGVVLRSLLSLAALFILAKLIGRRQVSNMNLFDYINGITIGSIAAEAATGEFSKLLPCLTAMVVYGVSVWGVNLLAEHSMKLRGILDGKPLKLFENGHFYRDNLKKSKITLSEFLALCRTQGYYDLTQVYAVSIEPNGRLAVLPRESYRPATPEDLGIPMKDPPVQPVSVISDGVVLHKNLSSCGKDENWLKKQMKAQNVKLSKTVLAMAEGDTLTVFTDSKDSTQ